MKIECNIKVTCDRCNSFIELPMGCNYGEWDIPEGYENDMIEKGWLITELKQCFCPSCHLLIKSTGR